MRLLTRIPVLSGGIKTTSSWLHRCRRPHVTWLWQTRRFTCVIASSALAARRESDEHQCEFRFDLSFSFSFSLKAIFSCAKQWDSALHLAHCFFKRRRLSLFELVWMGRRMRTEYCLSPQWSSGEDLQGDRAPPDSNISTMTWPHLTWSCRRHEMQLWIDLSRECWLRITLRTYSGAC